MCFNDSALFVRDLEIENFMNVHFLKLFIFVIITIVITFKIHVLFKCVYYIN